MKKNYFIAVFLLFIGSTTKVLSQVGINTQVPKTTLDVFGKAGDPNITDGITAPRLTGDQVKAKDNLYGSEQTGAIVFVSQEVSVPSEKTKYIVNNGYYFFNGFMWRPLTDVNIVGTNTSTSNSGTNGKLSGADNTAYGNTALAANTTGEINTAIGSLSLSKNIEGSENTSIGYGALEESTFGDGNTAVGTNALGKNTSGNFNLGLGPSSLGFNTTGSSNVAIGLRAGQHQLAGSENISIGSDAMRGKPLPDLGSAYNASQNISVGGLAGHYLTEGNRNIFLGYRAGEFIGTGSNNIFIGTDTGNISATVNNALTNVTAIGNFIKPTANNTVILGSLTSGYESNTGIGTYEPTNKLHVKADNPIRFEGVKEYADNAAAITAGLQPGVVYRTGDLLKIVH